MSGKSGLRVRYRRQGDVPAKGGGLHRRLKMLAPVLLVAIVAILFMSMGGARPPGSNPVAQSSPQPASDPPGTIDGARNPELIPDDVAYRLVLLAVAERENATDAEKARFRAKIASAGLNEDDTLAIRARACQCLGWGHRRPARISAS